MGDTKATVDERVPQPRCPKNLRQVGELRTRPAGHERDDVQNALNLVSALTSASSGDVNTSGFTPMRQLNSYGMPLVVRSHKYKG